MEKKKSIFKPVFLITCLMLLSALVFSGCFFTLDTPTLKMSGGDLIWSEVSNANGYEIVLKDSNGNETTYNTKETQFNVSAFIKEGVWKAKVKATAGSIFHNSSSFSQEVEFNFSGEITAPNDVVIKKSYSTQNKVVASWTSILGATSYDLELIDPDNNLKSLTTQTNQAFLDDVLDEVGTYQLFVRAVRTIGTETKQSDFSDVCVYDYVQVLDTPNLYDFKKNGSNYTISWEAVKNASSYKVSLLGSDRSFVSHQPFINLTESDLPALAKFDGAFSKTALQVAFVQAVSSTEYYESSDFSLGKIYYGKDLNKSNLSKLSLSNFYSSMTPESDDSFDFCADNQTELNSLIRFVVYYRIQDVTFYKNFSAEKDMEKAFLNYGEIMSLERSERSYGDGKIEETIYYDTPSTPTQTAYLDRNGHNQNRKQQNFGVIDSYSTNPRSDNPDFEPTDLPVYTRAKTLNVYTSEQLFMAVQAGFLPVFAGDCGASIVWDKACQVAMNILDDNMTDYQKVLAIFDWVAYTNIYDYNLVTYDLNMETLRDYKGWYLEGMFLDDGQAVCDGISKAFALLCGIEDIWAYKVNGYAEGNHAWNKVCIDIDNDSNPEWYALDATWTDIRDTTKEFLTHRYFLKTDAQLAEDHTENFPKLNVANTPFDYFANTFVKVGDEYYDMIISNDAERNFLLPILTENFDNFEVKSSVRIDRTMLPIGWNIKAYDDFMTGDYIGYVCYRNTFG